MAECMVGFLDELMVLRALYDFCRSMGGMGTKSKKFFALQLISSLDYLHNEVKIAHRDIKLENLLLDEQLKMKIADFDLYV